ncbi:MAG TPA: LysR family transcriptional regulator [Verrucomicrobiae bacterium]|nr:LysR family transcriptional regulator [Verrucomicrobiae bacterium]
MNIHHLELFYYVARHGGIMEAVRNIPYGIQQPAVSGQVAQLEQFLGVTLFRRRPFALTAEGQRLFAFIEPFFAGLDSIVTELQGGQARQVRIGASTIVLRDHLPAIIPSVKRKFPGLRVLLRNGYPAEFETLLHSGELDLAITLLEKKSMTGLRSEVLLEAPLALLVHRDSPITAANQLWSQDRIDTPLICLPPGELVTRLFQQKLRQMKIDWFPAIEASSADLIDTYVSAGLGIGLSVLTPHWKRPAEVRALPLDGFPPILMGALWRGKPNKVIESFVSAMRSRASGLSPKPGAIKA